MKFSIIIPCYNLAEFIRETLDSVLDQTCADWECICIDDGSTDGTDIILDDYAVKDRRFHVIHQVNSGVAAARNAGLRQAQGMWLAFLDGDDLWHPQLLEICAETLLRHPNCQAVRFSDSPTENPRVLLEQIGRIRQVTSSVISCEKWTVASSFPGMVSHVFNRSLVGDIFFPTLKVGEDNVWTIKCLARVSNIVDLRHLTLYAYRLRPGSAMHSNFTAQKLCDNIIWMTQRVKIIAASLRPVDDNVRWGLVKSLTINFSKEFFSMPCGGRKTAWQIWLREMSDILPSGIISGWCYGGAKICLVTRSQFMFWLLFRLPLWVKQCHIQLIKE